MKVQTTPGNDSETMANSPAVKSVPYISRPFPDPLPPPPRMVPKTIDWNESRRMCVRNRWKKPAVIKVCAGSFHRWKYAVRLEWGSVPKPRTWRALAFVSSGGAASITERDLEASDGR